MAIRARLTTAEELAARQTGGGEPTPSAGPATKPAAARSEQERAIRKERVTAAKDALKRSAGLRGDHVAPARAALKSYLQHLNDRDQPSDDVFKAMLEAPFRAPDKGGRGRRGDGRPGTRGEGRPA